MSKAWSAADIPDQRGKTFVVTGANSGIGLEAVIALAGKGANVVMACRSPGKARDAEARVRSLHPGCSLEVRSLDLSSLQSVRAFAADLAKDHPRIDVLVNNAGIMAIPRTLTADGFEMQLGTNHLGHFALTGLLLPALAAAPAARVVSVASTAHRWGTMRWDDLMGERRYDKWAWYGQSKLANLLFSFELSRRLAKAHPAMAAIACHPGYAATNLQGVGPRMENAGFTARIMETGNALLAQSAADGALPTLRAACDPEAKSGEYYGPRGLFELVGAPVKVGCTRAAKSEPDARRLWEESMRLTEVRFLA
jgi:NAD(P)-dependent dehydrogenase (short-subunit alcohol dehydrogenase family)